MQIPSEILPREQGHRVFGVLAKVVGGCSRIEKSRLSETLTESLFCYRQRRRHQKSNRKGEMDRRLQSDEEVLIAVASSEKKKERDFRK